jgi:CDP-diacylglycerol---serine O-phosphatidyltransferase
MKLFNVPNLFSLGNLLCGCIATLNIIEANFYPAAVLVGIACVLDFLDGFAARGLKQGSELGKQLDSLADMVTFGVVPGMVMFQLIRFSLGRHGAEYPEWILNYLPYAGFLVPLFSGLRLAKFNVDTRQSESFIGLPTLANAILIVSLPLAAGPDTLRPWLLIVLTLVFSFLLISPLPMFSFKIKSIRWKGNEVRYIFLALSIGMIIALKLPALPFVVGLYVLLSVVNNLLPKR